jgi:hypothetical protein
MVVDGIGRVWYRMVRLTVVYRHERPTTVRLFCQQNTIHGSRLIPPLRSYRFYREDIQVEVIG